MEGLKTRAYVFSGVLLAIGAWMLLTPQTDYGRKTEDEVIAMAPERVGDMPYARGPEDPRITYRMDEFTYKTLDPFGIVARRYGRGSKVFDVVVIASRSKDSFHDPRVCFSAQGWTLEKLEPATFTTKTRGTIPYTLISMSSQTVRHKLAAFLYKGPGRFYGNTQSLKWGMFWEQIKGGKDIDGVFYRVIPDYDGATVEELEQFLSDYLEAAKVSSNGYY